MKRREIKISLTGNFIILSLAAFAVYGFRFNAVVGLMTTTVSAALFANYIARCSFGCLQMQAGIFGVVAGTICSGFTSAILVLAEPHFLEVFSNCGCGGHVYFNNSGVAFSSYSRS